MDVRSIKIRVGPAPLGAGKEMKGTARDDLDVRAIRGARSQSEFANAIGVPVGTLANWEQGRRKPTGPARVLLRLIERDPDIVQRVMATPAADDI
jgi:DNA-binding transcriptional regulator YiaG